MAKRKPKLNPYAAAVVAFMLTLEAYTVAFWYWFDEKTGENGSNPRLE